MSHFMRGWSAGLALLLLLTLALAGGASAYEEVHLSSVLEARNLSARTLTIGGVVYEVGSRTRMRNLEGEEIGIEDLVPFDVKAGLFTEKQATLVEIEASQVRGRWVLDSLQQIRKLPE